MRVRRSKKPLPKWWRGHPKAKGIAGEYTIRVAGFSRLRAKVLIFKSRRDLRRFWTWALGRGDLGPRVNGAVTELSWNIRDSRTGPVKAIEVDPRFFCLIGLLERQMGSLVLAHEAGHAAFAYSRRIRKTLWDEEIDHKAEEAVCYPLGELFESLEKVKALHLGLKTENSRASGSQN